MWILTSLSRPDRIRNLVDSYQWGDESQVLLTLWKGDVRLPEYRSQQWPINWRIKTVPMRGNGPTYQEMLRRYPSEKCYGFLADDVKLETPGMLKELERAAGDWNVAYPDDGRWHEHLCTMPCIGGDLVRACGWLAPPGFMHWAIDNVWQAVGGSLSALRYQKHLKYTHLHPINGLANNDATYESARLASVGWDQLLRGFVMGRGLRETVSRVLEAQHA